MLIIRYLNVKTRRTLRCWQWSKMTLTVCWRSFWMDTD